MTGSYREQQNHPGRDWDCTESDWDTLGATGITLGVRGLRPVAGGSCPAPAALGAQGGPGLPLRLGTLRAVAGPAWSCERSPPGAQGTGRASGARGSCGLGEGVWGSARPEQAAMALPPPPDELPPPQPARRSPGGASSTTRHRGVPAVSLAAAGSREPPGGGDPGQRSPLLGDVPAGGVSGGRSIGEHHRERARSWDAVPLPRDPPAATRAPEHGEPCPLPLRLDTVTGSAGGNGDRFLPDTRSCKRSPPVTRTITRAGWQGRRWHKASTKTTSTMKQRQVVVAGEAPEGSRRPRLQS